MKGADQKWFAPFLNVLFMRIISSKNVIRQFTHEIY